MDKKTERKNALRELAPVRLIICALSLMLIAAAYILRDEDGKMRWVYYHVSRPYHEFMARLCSHARFSAAELFYAVAVGFVLVYIIVQIVRLIKRPEKGRRVYIMILTLGMICLLFWAAYSYLWTPYYYAPTFSQQAGIDDGGVTDAELETVTEYFVALADEYADKVPRGADGLYSGDRGEILDRAAKIYDETAAAEWKFLAGDELRPKGIICSKVMSLTDFTGFFFPLTGEANLNMDSPAVMLPSTAEHELSHQRGIGEEQECNFVAVAACMASDDPDFRYSGALMAYIYLSNALYSEDKAAWKQINGTLSKSVKADINQNNKYWEGYEDTFVYKVSNSAYESFLQGNGQTLGLKSYGACVDLLVNYYYPAAKA
jgi:multisubunit Na+/H+ antiporter MnhB subunit